MKDTEYVYAVAYMKTLENKMLNSRDIEQLINAPGYREAVKILKDMGYGKNVAKDAGAEELLKAELDEMWREAKACTPTAAPLDILKYKNDFHNMKTILKAYVTNSEWMDLMLYPSVSKPTEIYEAVKRADFSGLPVFIKKAAEEGYKSITSGNDGRDFEILTDKLYFEQLLEAASGNTFLEKWVEMNIIFTDILIALRGGTMSRASIEDAMISVKGVDIARLAEAAVSGRKAVAEVVASMGYSDGAQRIEENIGEFEKWCDNKRMEYLKAAGNSFFGFEPIMALLLGKEAEIQAVRIVLAGKKNGISAESIRERLRDLYV